MKRQTIGGILLLVIAVVILVVALTTKGIFSPIGATLNISLALYGAYAFWIEPMWKRRRKS